MHHEPSAYWPEIPAADVEVDFDIEWDRDGSSTSGACGSIRALRSAPPPTSVWSLSRSWTRWGWGRAGRAVCRPARGADRAAEIAGKSLRIFHWHVVEVDRTRKFARVAQLLECRCIDLLDWFNTQFRARGSSTLKYVAPLFGLSWDVDDDAGGSTSMLKIEQARAPEGAEARECCLRFNEADAAAQPAIRDGLRQAPQRI